MHDETSQHPCNQYQLKICFFKPRSMLYSLVFIRWCGMLFKKILNLHTVQVYSYVVRSYTLEMSMFPPDPKSSDDLIS